MRAGECSWPLVQRDYPSVVWGLNTVVRSGCYSNPAQELRKTGRLGWNLGERLNTNGAHVVTAEGLVLKQNLRTPAPRIGVGPALGICSKQTCEVWLIGITNCLG